MPWTAPSQHQVIPSDNNSIKPLPATGNPLHPISKDTSLAFDLPYSEAPGFLASIKEIPLSRQVIEDDTEEADGSLALSSWVMKAAKNDASSSKRPIGSVARTAWVGFVDLIKVKAVSSNQRISFAEIRVARGNS